jgi:hypothetical protein
MRASHALLLERDHVLVLAAERGPRRVRVFASVASVVQGIDVLATTRPERRVPVSQSAGPRRAS